jgi:hypothetical protein
VAGGDIVVGLLSSILGGAAVAASTYFGNRKRTAAETRKLDAEADRIRAETTKLLLEVSSLRVAVVADLRPPTGWHLYESNPRSYDVGVDHEVRHGGSRSGYLHSRPVSSGFGTLMQAIRSDRFTSKRVRLAGYIKTDGAEGRAGLWMRVDGPNGETVGFDNMEARPIRGTTDWTPQHVVLDVPDDSIHIAFGLLLVGAGRAWVDDVDLTTVGQGTPLTTLTADTGNRPDHPVNLDFED